MIMKISTFHDENQPIMMKISTYHDENLDCLSQKSRPFVIKSWPFIMKILTVCHENKSHLLTEMAFHKMMGFQS